MKATIFTTTETLKLEGIETNEKGKANFAVEGGIIGFTYLKDGKPVSLLLPLKSLIKIEIHE